MNPHTRTAPWHDRSAARWSTVKRSILAPAAVALLVGLNPDGPVATELPSDAALAQPEFGAPTNDSAGAVKAGFVAVKSSTASRDVPGRGSKRLGE